MIRLFLIAALAALSCSRAAAGEPVQAKQLVGTIGASDYPSAAIESRENGTVTARFTIGRDGRVRDCTATSDGYAPILRLWTCFLLNERFRYEPARDQQNRVVEEYKTQRVTWLLPGLTAPVAAGPLSLRPFVVTTEFAVSSEGQISDCTTSGSASITLRDHDLCDRMTQVAPYRDAAERAVAKRVTLTTSLEAETEN